MLYGEMLYGEMLYDEMLLSRRFRHFVNSNDRTNSITKGQNAQKF